MFTVPIRNCKHRVLYAIQGRNLNFGIYDEKDQSFLGIRYKFGDRFLDREWHIMLEYGTAAPKLEVIDMPPTLPCLTSVSQEIFDWIDQQIKYTFSEVT